MSRDGRVNPGGGRNPAAWPCSVPMTRPRSATSRRDGRGPQGRPCTQVNPMQRAPAGNSGVATRVLKRATGTVRPVSRASAASQASSASSSASLRPPGRHTRTTSRSRSVVSARNRWLECRRIQRSRLTVMPCWSSAARARRRSCPVSGVPSQSMPCPAVVQLAGAPIRSRLPSGSRSWTSGPQGICSTAAPNSFAIASRSRRCR